MGEEIEWTAEECTVTMRMTVPPDTLVQEWDPGCTRDEAELLLAYPVLLVDRDGAAWWHGWHERTGRHWLVTAADETTTREGR